MPMEFISALSLPPATVSSVPVYELVSSSEGSISYTDPEQYYECCGKSICRGCIHSLIMSGDWSKCPFCLAERHRLDFHDEQDENRDNIADVMKRVQANDAGAMCRLAQYYSHGLGGFQQDHAKSTEIYARAAELGCPKAHCILGREYQQGGDGKRAYIHFEASALAGNEMARYSLGCIEFNSGNVERAVKHWKIAASAGSFRAMDAMRTVFVVGRVSREMIDSTLTAYNTSCAEMRSEARDAYMHADIGSSINEKV
jgi:hypothetical protein